MGLSFRPEQFDATYFGYSNINRLSNYHTPYNGKGLKKALVLSGSALLMGMEFWRKEGLKKLNIIDLGGATGLLTAYLNKLPGVDAYNMDLSRWATQNAVSPIRHRVTQGNICSIPFKTECFDGLVSLDVLEHLPEDTIEGTIKEMYRILKPGGLGIVVVNTDHFGDFDGDITHQTKQEIQWWKEKFTKGGFELNLPSYFPGRNLLNRSSYITWRLKALDPSLLVVSKTR